MKMRKSDGLYAKNDTKNANVFLTHFNNLFNNLTGTNFDPTVIEGINDRQPKNEKLGTTPTKWEISKALRKMRYEKSPGPNGIPTEAFKNLEGESFDLLYNLIKKYWEDTEYSPNEMTLIKLSILPKKGDLSNPNKWRTLLWETLLPK